MKRLLLNLAMIAALGGLLSAPPALAQVSPTTKKASKVRIAEGPTLERTDADSAIIRWTTNNPGGSPVHYGIVCYGTDPKDLNKTAKSPIRLNPGHPFTVFRVRMQGLEPGTTYYYKVGSEEAGGTSDGVKSSVNRFKTPAAPQRADCAAIEPRPRDQRGMVGKLEGSWLCPSAAMNVASSASPN